MTNILIVSSDFNQCKSLLVVFPCFLAEHTWESVKLDWFFYPILYNLFHVYTDLRAFYLILAHILTVWWLHADKMNIQQCKFLVCCQVVPVLNCRLFLATNKIFIIELVLHCGQLFTVFTMILTKFWLGFHFVPLSLQSSWWQLHAIAKVVWN